MGSSCIRLLMVLCFSLAALHAQVAARLEGSIEDQTAAAVPGAKVSAVNDKTQSRHDTTAGADGRFIFPVIQPGTYTLTAEANGFRKSVVSNVEINVAGNVSLIIKLELGQAAETITVEANSVSVQVSQSQISRAVNLKDIDTLPSLARSPIILAAYQPGVSTDAGDPTFSRVNGARQGSNNARLDGIDINDSVVPRLGLSLTANNTDSIGEFRIILQGGSAEYGRNAGGQVELVTRSGTNQYHGNAFEYLRNTQLNANQFFSNQSGTLRPKFIQNLFGGSFGGPILKNRTFIFGNIQRRDTKQETVRNRTVLSPEAKAGLFRWAAGGTTQQFDIVANDPLKRGVDPQVKKLFGLLPTSNNGDLGDGLNQLGYRFNNPSGSYEDQFTIRGDHNLTSAHRVFMRWSWQRNLSIDALNSADAPFPGGVQGSQGGHRWGYGIGSDWSLTPTTVNEFRIGHQSASVAFNRPARIPGVQILPNLYTNPILPNFAQGRNSPVLDMSDSITKIWGKHVFKAGFSFRNTLQYGYNDGGIYPNVSLATSNGNLVASTFGPQGLSSTLRTRFEQLYNDVLGRMDRVVQSYYSDLKAFQGPGVSRVRNFTLNESGYFFQDDWKVARNFTINAGMRYEYFAVPKERDTLQGTLDKVSSISSTSQIGDMSVVRTNNWYNPDKNNFAPRIGFAWDVKGNGRTAVRANYGIFFDRAIGAVVSAADGNTPGFSFTSEVFPNSVAGSDNRAGVAIPATAQPAAPVLTLPQTRSFTTTVFNPNLSTGYLQSFSLNVQHEVMRNTIVELGYVGSRGVKLFMNRDLNQVRINEDFLKSFKEIQAFQSNQTAPSAGNTLVKIYGTPAAVLTGLGASNFTQGRVGTAADNLDRSQYTRYTAAGVSQFYLRNFPQFNQLQYGNNDGRSYYNSMQMSIRRNTGALRMAANYTFSRNVDNISVDGNGFTNVIDNFNLRLNRGRGDADRPHVFNTSVSYTIPFGKGKKFGGSMNRFADSLLGGWDVGVLSSWQSGSPFTVSSQRATTAGQTTWANYSGDRNIGAVDRRGDGVFFYSAEENSRFGYPAAGDIGNSGRNSFRNPRYFNADASLIKRFKLFEGHAVTFRAEAYNVFNNVNFTGLSTNLDTPATFGKFSGTTAARIMQLALRYDF